MGKIAVCKRAETSTRTQARAGISRITGVILASDLHTGTGEETQVKMLVMVRNLTCNYLKYLMG